MFPVSSDREQTHKMVSLCPFAVSLLNLRPNVSCLHFDCIWFEHAPLSLPCPTHPHCARFADGDNEGDHQPTTLTFPICTSTAHEARCHSNY